MRPWASMLAASDLISTDRSVLRTFRFDGRRADNGIMDSESRMANTPFGLDCFKERRSNEHPSAIVPRTARGR